MRGARRDTLRFDPPEDPATRDGAPAEPAAHADESWMLQSHVGDGSLRMSPLHPLPFRIGRQAGLDLVLASVHVSKLHAEIYSEASVLRIRDLGSRNGTFVNHEAVSDAALHEGDVIHFGDFEFRVSRGEGGQDLDDSGGTLIRTGPLPARFVQGGRHLRELLEEGAVTMVFQPIVRLPTRRVVACEALGRGRHPSLPESPVELLRVAATVGLEGDLSRLFRHKAVELVRGLEEPPALFLNTHPVELQQPGLLESLEELRAFAPQVDLVLEIHESALAQGDFISWLRARLSEINVGLAYDDFGSGQARLLELAEAPPHYLKFDRRFVTGLNEAPVSRRRLVASLAAAARELLVATVAEGVETEAEADACVRAGFTHAQGYHFGRPVPLEGILKGGPV
jgi:EAL domain-containing protein (putative c-di-GMP-specific phosphodiesterase class I)